MATRRKQPSRTIVLDRSLEALPIFRLSDSSDEASITWSPPAGGRWRVLPAPGERLPGTFDQDVYVEVMRRYHEAGAPADGTVSFTLHAFLRAMGRRVDGRTYEQLRSALTRLERTLLESTDCYREGSAGPLFSGQMAVLALVQIDRRRMTDRDQLGLFPLLTSNEPGDARVTIAAPLRANIAAGWSVTLSSSQYWSLNSPVARRLYRLLEVARANGHATWRVPLEQLAEQLPLVQRFPSHLQRVLQPAHEMLVTSGAAREAVIEQDGKNWVVSYRLGQKAT
ncbi:MAG: replication initiator protein A [Opitutaceae bacterium]|nr:replication initiator protein A [Gemmatimonadota bacterium]